MAGFGLLGLWGGEPAPSQRRPSPRVPSGTLWQQAESLATVTAGRGGYTGAERFPVDGTQDRWRGWSRRHIPPQIPPVALSHELAWEFG